MKIRITHAARGFPERIVEGDFGEVCLQLARETGQDVIVDVHDDERVRALYDGCEVTLQVFDDYL
jgi:hypothetical protein